MTPVGPPGVVVVVVVDEVDVVVVVDVLCSTKMVTVLPGVNWVPDEGVWLVTKPAWNPGVATSITMGTRFAALISLMARASVMGGFCATSGMIAAGPFETIKPTVDP